MNQTAKRFIGALLIAGASLLPAAVSAQGAYGSDVPKVTRVEFEGTQPYYYDASHHRHMMTVRMARAYAKQQDPQWYAEHKSEWRNDPHAFLSAWREHYEYMQAHLNQGGGAK
jgi:hypothetical protein